MFTIVIAPLPVPGHVNPSLRLARSLQRAGHRVVYLGIPEIEDEVRAEGFDFRAVFGDVLPKGRVAELRGAASRLKGFSLLGFLRTQVLALNQVLLRLEAGELEGVLREVGAELLVCDEKLRHLAVLGHGLKLPVLQMNVTVPPEFIPLPAGAKRGPGRGAAIPFEGLLVALGLVPRLRASLEALAKKHGYPLRRERGHLALERALSPELLLCPREFAEVRVKGAPGEYCFTEPCIDLERQEADFPWEQLDDGRPLVSFALGTLAGNSPHHRSLLQAAFDAAALRPDWRFVIAVGSTFDPASFPARANVVAVRVAPQLGLLRRAAVMVNHAGTNSVKECIAFGVPMVAIPLQFDQPDIGRLVEMHGVGRVLAPRDVTAERLAAALDDVLDTDSYRDACLKLREHFRRAEAGPGAAGAIEDFLARRASRLPDGAQVPATG
ncbi:glycosyltransferase [Corallococcus terminator]|uniref:Glycosyltransferase n=1 Tax=Corallococcus terminator TaxID=2316733 RepID=A0A3A8J902_9BACT|nr:nucleotide disphospho-sugar-binding domain-containing protein [Corallococcus terminator]RKG88704.1 hypothetical protein D7V88_13815 [Corallococcus terminator]